jgi:chemotaxis protein CheX
MNNEFIAPFADAVKTTLGIMASIEVVQHEAQIKEDHMARGELSSIIGMIAPQTSGSMAITFDKDLSLAMMKNMLGETLHEVNEEVADMIGEMTNMICGSAKASLADQGYDFNMASPVVVSGTGHLVHHHVKGPSRIVKFTSSQGTAYLEVCFNK